jgi:hypothetical protein
LPIEPEKLSELFGTVLDGLFEGRVELAARLDGVPEEPVSYKAMYEAADSWLNAWLGRTSQAVVAGPDAKRPDFPHLIEPLVRLGDLLPLPWRTTFRGTAVGRFRRLYDKSPRSLAEEVSLELLFHHQCRVSERFDITWKLFEGWTDYPVRIMCPEELAALDEQAKVLLSQTKEERAKAMSPEEARAWFAALSPEDQEKEASYLLECAAVGWIKEGEGRAQQLRAVPPTPERQSHLEMVLDMFLDREVRKADADPGARHLGYADTKPIVEHLTRLDSLLAPDSWRPLLRGWAKRRVEELSQAGDQNFTTVDALSAYLGKVKG